MCNAKIQRYILKRKAAPVAAFVLVETDAPAFRVGLDRDDIVAHRLAFGADARSTSNDRYLPIVPSRWLDCRQVRDVLVPMEHQPDLSADAPLQEVLGFFEGDKPVVGAEPGKDALI